ncbi:MAG: hypothetical protein MUF10_18085 [Thermoanaerobaculaceae bacterium]|jgi:hypothetical protein|nr:hypothetical protein [Thermoanaerobaculaceae bacterium]
MGTAIIAAATGVVLVGTFAWYRRWHLRWGATDEEIAAPMPGDDVLSRAPFRATRAITIDAAPEQVWPWIVQIGFGRGGFYSYDLLDNLGRPSADCILPEHQHLEIGGVAAPMASPPNERNSFRVAGFEPNRWLLWVKPGSSWAWRLTPLDDGARTRLVTRLKAADRLPWALLSAPLMEVGDFPMMRRQLLGIKARAEAAADPGPHR